ncbi:hypothetical protein BC832DRAFT_568147 [Gaertneriomyces semiglobifer]|nr:hypothetical protein BC832DRAFT_568147 [Gaertneriomyces semiglobifer]
MSSILTTATTIAIAITVHFLYRLVEHPRLPKMQRMILILFCLSHIIQRFTMTFYYDTEVPRSCFLLALIGNTFGLSIFRFCLIFMLGTLCMKLMQRTTSSKVIVATSTIAFIASTAALLYNTISAKITDPSSCTQELSKVLTITSNFSFLGSFLVVAIPVILFLQRHVNGTVVTVNTTVTVKAIYVRQRNFMIFFSICHVALSVTSYYIESFTWLLLTFIAADCVWINGTILWLMPTDDERSKSSSNSVAGRLDLDYGPTSSMKGVRDQRQTQGYIWA